MKSSEYKEIVRQITKNALVKRYPALKKKELDEVANTIARNVHARMYGANVDDVDSPLWRKDTPEFNG